LNSAVAAPQYVPNTLAEQPRRGLDVPAPDRWVSDRPGELVANRPLGPEMGRPGPDQGFALKLAHVYKDKLQVRKPETHHDAIIGCVGVATARASLYGRAPVIHDLDIAFRVWGFLGDAPQELLDLRVPMFEACAHRYEDQRAIVDQVPEATLLLSHGEVAQRFPSQWRSLLGLG
jgi:hypothetical protein